MQYTPISDLAGIRDGLQATFRAGVPRSIEWRRHQLLQLARMVQENPEAFNQAISKDISKPKAETYFTEIAAIVERTLVTAEKFEEWANPTIVDPWSPKIYKAEKGTVLIIAPWNYPMFLTLQPLMGAIAAGCCAVVKPSEISSHYSALLSELAPKYLDTSAFRIVLGGIPETAKLLEFQWDHIFYTGNARVGRIIATAAAKHLTPLTLELGGKCPVIIDPAYDVKVAAKRTLWGKSLNGGQTCASPDYVLIPRAHQAAFTAALKEACAAFYPDGSMASDSISRIVTPTHHARLMDLLKRTKGKVAFGGTSDFEGLKIEMTAVEDVSGDDSLMEGEIFGPILAIVPVDSLHDAIEFVRDRHHPLCLYAFTDNEELKNQILQGTLSGNLTFNDTLQQLAVKELPFNGVGESGYGGVVLKYTFNEFSYERGSMDMPKEAEPFLGVRYAPYTEENFKIIAAPAFLEIPEK